MIIVTKFVILLLYFITITSTITRAAAAASWLQQRACNSLSTANKRAFVNPLVHRHRYYRRYHTDNNCRRRLSDPTLAVVANHNYCHYRYHHRQHRLLHAEKWIRERRPQREQPTRRYLTSTKTEGDVVAGTTTTVPKVDIDNLAPAAPETPRHIILWRGEKASGYSLQFRHLEFVNALAATSSSAPTSSVNDTGKYRNEPNQGTVRFVNATNATNASPADHDGALQYLELPTTTSHPASLLSDETIIEAASRCGHVRALYEIIGIADSYPSLAAAVLSETFPPSLSSPLHDVMTNDDVTWCLRLRDYCEGSSRYGKNVRSPLRREREAITGMRELVERFRGSVDLKGADVRLYVMEGLVLGKKVLARRLVEGKKTSPYAPKTRKCITNTPLCPVTAFAMCNIARIRPHISVLDPYAGSCATLLAAAALAAPSPVTAVGIEISDGVNFDRVEEDFEVRGLPGLRALVRGDCREERVREEIRRLVVGGSFDAIVTDPPYGVREAVNLTTRDVGGGTLDVASTMTMTTPLEEFFAVMAYDRHQGKPLLKVGGRFVGFVPVTSGQSLDDVLPNENMAREAGLMLVTVREQPLNKRLSRWLVVYDCVD